MEKMLKDEKAFIRYLRKKALQNENEINPNNAIINNHSLKDHIIGRRGSIFKNNSPQKYNNNSENLAEGK